MSDIKTWVTAFDYERQGTPLNTSITERRAMGFPTNLEFHSTPLEDDGDALGRLLDQAELGAAWAEAEAALPEGGWLDGVTRVSYDSDAEYRATAMHGIPGGIDILKEADAPTHAAALRALSAKLRGEG